MNHETNSAGHVEVSIQELRLRPGTELKILDSKGRMLGHKAQFVAVFAGKSILTSLLVNNTKMIEIRAGDSYLIKGFTGKYDFSFTSSVLQLDSAQFNARFSCPDTVAVKFVRSHLRADLELTATVTAKGMSNPTAIIVKDLSIGGAGLVSSEALGNIGDRINLSLQVEFEKKNVDLTLAAIIKHISESFSGIRTGVEFESTSQNDKLMLYYCVNTLSEPGDIS